MAEDAKDAEPMTEEWLQMRLHVSKLVRVRCQVEALNNSVEIYSIHNGSSLDLMGKIPRLRELVGEKFEEETEESIKLCVLILTGLHESVSHAVVVACLDETILEGWLEFVHAMLRKSVPKAKENHTSARKLAAIKLMQSLSTLLKAKDQVNLLRTKIEKETKVYLDLLGTNDSTNRHKIIKLAFTCFPLIDSYSRTPKKVCAYVTLLESVFKDFNSEVRNVDSLEFCVLADTLGAYPSGRWTKLETTRYKKVKNLQYDIALMRAIVEMYPELLEVYDENFDLIYNQHQSRNASREGSN